MTLGVSTVGNEKYLALYLLKETPFQAPIQKRLTEPDTTLIVTANLSFIWPHVKGVRANMLGSHKRHLNEGTATTSRRWSDNMVAWVNIMGGKVVAMKFLTSFHRSLTIWIHGLFVVLKSDFRSSEMHLSINIDQVSLQEYLGPILQDKVNCLINCRLPTFFWQIEDDINFWLMKMSSFFW